MKKLGIISLGILLILFLASNSFSYPVSIGQFIKLQDGPGESPGGSFLVKDWDSDTSLFYTYCVERDVTFRYDRKLKVTGITPLYDDDAIARIYLWYLSGETTSMGYSPTDIQAAIWVRLGQGLPSGYPSYSSNFQNLLTSADNYISDNNWKNENKVAVMNLMKKKRGGRECGEWIDAQDQLVAASVPEPGNMLLMGTGLIVFAGIGRRRLFKK